MSWFNKIKERFRSENNKIKTPTNIVDVDRQDVKTAVNKTKDHVQGQVHLVCPYCGEYGYYPKIPMLNKILEATGKKLKNGKEIIQEGVETLKDNATDIPNIPNIATPNIPSVGTPSMPSFFKCSSCGFPSPKAGFPGGKCPYCNDTKLVPLSMMDYQPAYQEFERKYLVPCPGGCGTKYHRDQLKQASFVCYTCHPDLMIACPGGCGTKYPKNVVESDSFTCLVCKGKNTGNRIREEIENTSQEAKNTVKSAINEVTEHIDLPDIDIKTPDIELPDMKKPEIDVPNVDLNMKRPKLNLPKLSCPHCHHKWP